MFKYIIAFVLFSPLIGIYLMEEGAYGIDVGMTGHPNGTFSAFLLYISTTILSFLFFRRISLINVTAKSNFSVVVSPYITFSIFNLFFLLIMLFGFGGINVLLGNVNKGEFRTSFGFFGALPFFISRYFSPALLAYLAFDYKKSNSNLLKSIFFFINVILVMLVGLTWGFKSTGIFMLAPALIIYYWNVRWYNVILIAIFSLIFLITTAVLFDKSELSFNQFSFIEPTPDNALAAVIYRMTVMQGNTPWYVWELYSQGVNLPDYSPTLLAAFGDKILSLFAGVDLSNMNEFAKYHFDVLLTALATDSFESRIQGHNITGTAFVDGVFIGGFYGIIFISILAGFIIGQCYNVISRAIEFDSPLIGSLASVYFLGYVFTWLNGGGVTILFHISTLLGLIITWLYLKFVSKIRLKS